MNKTIFTIILFFTIIFTSNCSKDDNVVNSISYRAVYTVLLGTSQELHISNLGSGEVESNTTRLTSGNYDMKPSWSKTGNMIAFFRYISGDLNNVPSCITKLCVINSDGTGYRELTAGTYGDFNPTWTRDGSNMIVFNRKNQSTGRWQAFIISPTGSPGDEQPVSRLDEAIHTCMKDGRMLTSTNLGIYALTPNPGSVGTYELVNRPDNTHFWQHFYLSPDETILSFEHDQDKNSNTFLDCYVCHVDFNVSTLTTTNITQMDTKSNLFWEGYPRWTSDSRYIGYHSNKSGTYQLYMYNVSDGTIQKVSTDASKSYLYISFENSPA